MHSNLLLLLFWHVHPHDLIPCILYKLVHAKHHIVTEFYLKLIAPLDWKRYHILARQKVIVEESEL